MRTFDKAAHNANVEKMEANHAETGRWVDPVSGYEFPAGDPNRSERRVLDYFRRTGGVKGRGTKLFAGGKVR